MITIIITSDYYTLSLLVIVIRGRTSISIVFCPPLFLHKMYTLLLLYEMLMCAGNKLNWIELSSIYNRIGKLVGARFVMLSSIPLDHVTVHPRRIRSHVTKYANQKWINKSEMFVSHWSRVSRRRIVSSIYKKL